FNAEQSVSAEHERLTTGGPAWKRWGPYLSERAWGTVREDYSADGSAGSYFPHDHARSRADRWNEDGLAGRWGDPPMPCSRRGPYGKGGAVRTGRAGGQPRRRREGILLVSRLDTHSFVHEDAVQIRAGRVPICRPGGDEQAAGQARDGIRIDRHGQIR